MKKFSAIFLLYALMGSAAFAQTIPNLGAGAAVGGTDLFPSAQAGVNPAKKVTADQIKTYVGTTVATGCGATGGTINPGSSGTIAASQPINAQTGASYAIQNGDCGKLITTSNAGAQAYSLTQAGTAGFFASGWFADFQNNGAGTVTITPTTSTINGAASYAIPTGQGARIVSDGTNYQVSMRGGAASGTVTSVTCPGGTFTTTGTCATDIQTFSATGTWNKVAGTTWVGAYGCGGGGGGGGGATVVSGTASSGGAGGGGGYCGWIYFKASDLPSSAAVTVPAVATGGTGSTTAGGAVGGNGQAGGSVTFGSVATWFGGGLGGGGQNSATVSTSGGGAGPWAVGQNASTAVSRGCVNGGATGNGTNQPAGCGGGGGGSSIAGAASNGAYALQSGPGGGSGAGVTTVPVGVSAAALTGGGGTGCATPPSGGAIGTDGGTAVNPDFAYHPGCGGAGGGGQLGNVGTPGNGSAGTAGAGGGGGGSVCSSGGSCTAQNGGAGGAGGRGFANIISW